MVEGTAEHGHEDFLALIAGEKHLIARLVAGERLRLQTPLSYPGRRGPVVVELSPGAREDYGPRLIRISDGGLLIRSLDEQGLDVSLDMIVSKTVVHAVKEVEGAGVGGSEVFLDSNSETVAADVWRFLQLLIELLGLRHSKYKDALLQLSRRPASMPDPMSWAERS